MPVPVGTPDSEASPSQNSDTNDPFDSQHNLIDKSPTPLVPPHLPSSTIDINVSPTTSENKDPLPVLPRQAPVHKSTK